MEHIYDIVIIGGGPGGYTAALYGARAGLRTLVVEKRAAGGQMALTAQVDNYPGFEDGIGGFELGIKMEQSALRFGAETIRADVKAVYLTGDMKVIETDEDKLYTRCVIIATGAVPKKLELAGESEMTGRGVSYCADCDGMFYRGKTAVVVGGGNSAAADALVLSRLCKKVAVIHRRDRLRAEKIYYDQLKQMENVEFYWNSIVDSLLYDEVITGIKVKNKITGQESILRCEGIFVSIGRTPASELFQGQTALDEDGYIIADETTRTNIPGVFAVGDIRTKAVRQIITAAADGATAIHYAEEYLTSLFGHGESNALHLSEKSV